MSVAAAHDGTCPFCGLAIRVGDLIVSDTTIDSVGVYAGPLRTFERTEWGHEVCPTPRGTSTCPQCFLERPCPCEDDQ